MKRESVGVVKNLSDLAISNKAPKKHRKIRRLGLKEFLGGLL